jgi:hypothetical protein
LKGDIGDLYAVSAAVVAFVGFRWYVRRLFYKEP